MPETMEDLSETTARKIVRLAENWGVSEEKLLEEFKNIYESLGD